MPLWTSKAAQYWILAIASSVTFITFLALNFVSYTSLPGIPALQIDAVRSSHKFEAFELEGISIALPFPECPASLENEQRLSWLIDTLDTRIRVLSDEKERPACHLTLGRFDPVLRLTSRSRLSHPISFAINLRDSQHVLPSQMRALLTAIHYLLPNHAVYLSIYENDSKDTTKRMLAELAAALEKIGIDGLWITSSGMHSGINMATRINRLAEIRNAALRPLLPHAGAGTVIFLNDVILCASDIFELILQSQTQSADVVLGVDWAESHIPSQPYVYDAWVLRGINGQMVYKQHKDTPWPMVPPTGRDWLTHAFSTQSEENHSRWLNNLPFPVYAGWGGIVALRADLFVEHGLRFRSSKHTGWTGGSVSGSMGKWGKLVTDWDYMNGDCPGDSECGLVMRDIWNIRAGRARVVLASQVNTAYSIREWKAARLILPFIPREDRFTAEELINWTKVTIPEGVICMPTRTEDGTAHDAHDTKLFRYLTLKPLYEPTIKPNVAYGR
ncbi:hypothetical protein AMS68_001368 [Peltaster fructicola]|uniref:Glycosyltransferase family 69 protein n=1 Tax=Peltaster fructicola TaxID=286661 RepID=A0A6H0XMI4_9PEZI|nr:hypothetical protein AMS68_001368 [Peltaster fructicola]